MPAKAELEAARDRSVPDVLTHLADTAEAIVSELVANSVHASQALDGPGSRAI